MNYFGNENLIDPENKKVLLHDRKRCTARGVSCPWCVLSGGEGWQSGEGEGRWEVGWVDTVDLGSDCGTPLPPFPILVMARGYPDLGPDWVSPPLLSLPSPILVLAWRRGTLTSDLTGVSPPRKGPGTRDCEGTWNQRLGYPFSLPVNWQTK